MIIFTYHSNIIGTNGASGNVVFVDGDIIDSVEGTDLLGSGVGVEVGHSAGNVEGSNIGDFSDAVSGSQDPVFPED